MWQANVSRQIPIPPRMGGKSEKPKKIVAHPEEGSSGLAFSSLRGVMFRKKDSRELELDDRRQHYFGLVDVQFN